LNPRTPTGQDPHSIRTYGSDTSLQNYEEVVEKFVEFCRVNLRLGELTTKDHKQRIKRFLKTIGKPIVEITEDDIRSYLMQYTNKAPITYAHHLGSIKVFFRNFLKMGYLVEDFRFPEIPIKPKNGIPDKGQLKLFYEALPSLREKSLFLMFATTGLRCCEVLNLTFKDIDFSRRMVTPNNHTGRTKKSWITFYNHECEQILNKYLKRRNINSEKLFPISRKRIETIFQETTLKTGIKITPQVLREWFCCEMGRLGVPDRYVDAFCGRVPRSVLARHYTDFSPEKLKEIYDKAGLKVLS